MPAVLIVATPDTFAGTAATLIVELIGRAVGARGECTMALCGGLTPVAVYQVLAALPVRWRDVAIFFGDERAVPADHADSNYAMARRTLLDRVPILPERIHRMPAERTDADGAAREYEAGLPPQLDILLLGMGPDGHTASLFPGSPAVLERSRRVVAVASPPLPIQPQVRRMTITPPVIGAARQVVVMARGSDKAVILRRILEGPEQPTTLPAQCARGGTWIVDQEAAAQLQPGNN